MIFVFGILIAVGFVVFWLFRFQLSSLFTYLSVRIERRAKGFQVLNSLRQSLIHERKKKMAGLEMILSSWEKGEEIQSAGSKFGPRYEYFEELLEQLKDLIREEKRNLMAVTKDIWLWGKLWTILRRIEKHSRKYRERLNIQKVRKDLVRLQTMIEKVVDDATRKFSFTLNELVRESVKIVKVEKSHQKNIKIKEQLDLVGDSVRFSYDKFKDWQKVLTNLIRNAVEAVEIKQSEGVGAAEGFSLPSGAGQYWVKISTKQIEKEIGQAWVPDLRRIGPSTPRRQGSPASGGICLRHDQPCEEVSVIIEDSGIGMDETTRSSFYKKGFTFGKDGGLGLGITEESMQFIDQYGNWQIESQKGVGTKISINIDREKSKKAELILPPPKPFFRTKLAWGLSVFVLALIGLSFLFTFDKYSRFWVDWNPAISELHGRHLIIKNKSEDVLWDTYLEAEIRPALLLPHDPLVKFYDLDDDGINEVLLGVDFTDSTTGEFACFNFKREKLWEFACGDSGIYQGKNKYYYPANMLVEDIDGDSKKEIIANSAHSIWFPFQVAVLDREGNKLSEYWHPGSLDFLDCCDFDEDGQKEIILAGINNSLGFYPVISVLQVDRLFGQAMPYNAAKNIDKAEEEWYVVFPHVKKTLPDESEWVHFLSGAYNVRAFTENDEIQVTIQDSRNYFFSLNFELRRIFDYNFRSWKDQLNFPYELTEEDKENWNNIAVWKEGKRIR